jgi:hypothetical protein
VAFGAIWLVTLWSAEVRRAQHAVLLVLVYVVVSGLPLTNETAMLSFSIVQSTVLLAALVWVIVRRPPATTIKA